MSPPRIALIGDSQAEALWPRVQKAMPDAEFVLSRFQRGWSEWHYHNEGKLAQELRDAKPDLVVIELGGNNAFTTQAKYQPHVDWVLEAARASGAKRILYFGPAAATKEPYKDNKEWTRSFQSQYLPTQTDVFWYDNFPHTQTGHVDGVHFGASIYNAWAPVIVEQIRSRLSGVSDIATRNPKKVLALAGLGVLFGSFLVALALKKLKPSR